MRLAAALTAALCFAAPVAALAEKGCFITYTGFEEKIAHIDIDVCPTTQVKAEDGFCRIGLDGPSVLVYTFRHMDAEACLVAVDRMDFNDFVGRFGASYDKP